MNVLELCDDVDDGMGSRISTVIQSSNFNVQLPSAVEPRCGFLAEDAATNEAAPVQKRFVRVWNRKLANASKEQCYA